MPPCRPGQPASVRCPGKGKGAVEVDSKVWDTKRRRLAYLLTGIPWLKTFGCGDVGGQNRLWVSQEPFFDTGFTSLDSGLRGIFWWCRVCFFDQCPVEENVLPTPPLFGEKQNTYKGRSDVQVAHTCFIEVAPKRCRVCGGSQTADRWH